MGNVIKCQAQVMFCLFVALKFALKLLRITDNDLIGGN